MKREYFSSSIKQFLSSTENEILGILSLNNEFPLEQTQRDAWSEEISLLKKVLPNESGMIYFEYSIPRMGRRIDVLLILRSVVFVLEFKVGDKVYHSYALDQVWDYALDLKNFHETSHDLLIAPILIATDAPFKEINISTSINNDKVLIPIKANSNSIKNVLQKILEYSQEPLIDIDLWEKGRYSPTPTIIEAAMAMYNNHSVEEIKRNDAEAINLNETTELVSRIIEKSRRDCKKSIVFVTGVPGAGKTLVGLNIATKHIDRDNDLYSVFLSGNGPLVAVLREALARDRVRYEKERGKKLKKGEANSEVKSFIQNVHNFRDDCLIDLNNPPIEHVALFDEAQRAWNIEKTTDFMKRRKNIPNFNISEPEFLISCLDRHDDWAVIVCLVGGGQEINTGEAGISEWIDSLNRAFPKWDIYISPRLTDSEYGAGKILETIDPDFSINKEEHLHLSVSMRSYRSEKVSLLVKQLLDLEDIEAKKTLSLVNKHYPIVLTRDLVKAKKWIKEQARGSERYGIVVSSQAERLKPYAIDVRSPMDPIHWFLDGKDDTRSSYYLEDVATEFHIQGLELDWVCVTWDADFRYSIKKQNWENWSFKGKKWQHINKYERKLYQKNAYRVLLTRARQGMVIVVPEGSPEDPTRDKKFYDSTFEYLKGIGFELLN